MQSPQAAATSKVDSKNCLLVRSPAIQGTVHGTSSPAIRETSNPGSHHLAVSTNWGSFVVRDLILRALLFWVYIRASDFCWNLEYQQCGSCKCSARECCYERLKTSPWSCAQLDLVPGTSTWLTAQYPRRAVYFSGSLISLAPLCGNLAYTMPPSFKTLSGISAQRPNVQVAGLWFVLRRSLLRSHSCAVGPWPPRLSSRSLCLDGRGVQNPKAPCRLHLRVLRIGNRSPDRISQSVLDLQVLGSAMSWRPPPSPTGAGQLEPGRAETRWRSPRTAWKERDSMGPSTEIF